VGTWTPGRRVPCAAAPAPGEACAGGGAFLLGDPALRGRFPTNDIVDERVVVLSPYFMSTTEVTVGQFRKAWRALEVAGVTPPTTRTSVSVVSGNSPDDWCTWTTEPAMIGVLSGDGLPLNCVSWDTARAYCRAQGGDLPSEAEYERAASGGGREWAFPWGDDQPDCEAASWGRGGYSTDRATVPVQNLSSDCRAPGSVGSVAASDTTTRDRIDAALLRGSGTLSDLGGNLSEWALDQWSRPAEAFWATARPMFDPVADVVSTGDGDNRAVRGGNWLDSASATRAGIRLRNAPADRRRSIGFRCARPATAGAGRP
jgi:formylglycine-generating enzyme required for sulfatase activity